MEQTAGERTEMQGYLQTSTSANLMMLPLKMEAVRIPTQLSELGVGGCFKTHTTKHFLPTPRAQGSSRKEEKKKKSQKRKIFLPAVGWAWDGCVLAIPHSISVLPPPPHPSVRVGIFFFLHVFISVGRFPKTE